MRALLSITAIAVLTGCPGTLEDPERFRVPPPPACDPDASVCDAGTSTTTLVTTQQVMSTILTPKCAFAGCHGGAAPQGMLDLSGTAGTVEARLIDQRSATAICGGRTLVAPGEPDRSLMYIKLSMTATLCGTMMPQGVPLTPAEKGLVRQWIVDLGVP